MHLAIIIAVDMTKARKTKLANNRQHSSYILSSSLFLMFINISLKIFKTSKKFFIFLL